jgi:hypothetical protein
MNKISKIKITQLLLVVMLACKHKWFRGKHRRVTVSNVAQEKVEKFFSNTKQRQVWEKKIVVWLNMLRTLDQFHRNSTTNCLWILQKWHGLIWVMRQGWEAPCMDTLVDYGIEILFSLLVPSWLHREPQERQYLLVQIKRAPIFLVTTVGRAILWAPFL